VTDNLPPSDGDSFWDRWHGPDEDADATAAEPAAQAPPTEPTQRFPPVPPPSQPWGGYAAPDAYQSGNYPQPGTWQSSPQPSNPGQPFPGQPYPLGPAFPGQPYASQQYPGQPYPPGQAWIGQQPGYPQQPYAGPPAQKPRRTGLFILLGVVGLCVVLVVGALLVRPGSTTTGTGTTGTGGAPTGRASGGGTPTVASAASDAVKGYLGALAAGDAATALGYAAAPPPDTTLLSDDVLAAGNAIAPITDIEVESSAASGSAQVQAHYSIGSDAVEATFAVVDSPTGWKLQQAGAQVSLDRLPSGATLNGVTLPSGDSLTLFPGSYLIGTADDRYQVSGGSFVVESPTDTASVNVTAKLSSRGVAAVRSAAQKRLDSCIKQNKLRPSDGCGFAIRAVDENGRKFTPRKVRWHITSGANTLTSLKLAVSPVDATVVTGKAKVRLYVRVDATNGRWYWATITIATVRAILGDDSVEVRFNE
jgi:hypothetical protein